MSREDFNHGPPCLRGVDQPAPRLILSVTSRCSASPQQRRIAAEIGSRRHALGVVVCVAVGEGGGQVKVRLPGQLAPHPGDVGQKVGEAQWEGLARLLIEPDRVKTTDLDAGRILLPLWS